MQLHFPENLKTGVAVSGGADSMVLLDLFRKANRRFTVVHVEHGIRGEESVADAQFVQDFCAAHGIRCLCYSVDAPEYAGREGVSLELAARTLRYNIFQELLQYGTFDVIALAHHKDDQAETVLMRLFRGSGVRGLCGITGRTGYIHPLLGYSKSEILEYAAKNGIPFVEDKTNYENLYTRNFIRNALMPLIETRFPDASSAIARAAEALKETEDFILSRCIPCEIREDCAVLPIGVLDAHPAVAKASVQETLRAVGLFADIESSHLEAILRLKSAASNARLNLPFGVDVYKEYDSLVFTARAEAETFSAPLDIRKRYSFCGKAYFFAETAKIGKGVFDADKIPADAVIRTKKPGDRFKKYGGGTKSLNDYFTDKKIPLRLRDRILVFTAGQDILAVPGYDIGDAIKADETTINLYQIHTAEET